MSALEQFKDAKRRAPLLSKALKTPGATVHAFNEDEVDLIVVSLDHFADQDESKQNCLRVGP